MNQFHAIAHIQSTLSNTIITITDLEGNVKAWCSSGTAGFKGSRRSTNYAAQATGDKVARIALQLGVKTIQIKTKGLGYGKESSIRGLILGGLVVTQICDITAVPHNGCRASKKRRI